MIDPQKQVPHSEAWRTIQTIDPNDRSDWSSFQILRRLGNRGTLVDDKSTPSDSPWLLRDGRKAFRLHPEQAQVYPLEVDRIGMPHTVIVRIPSGSEMRIAVSILDVEATGKLETLSLDSALLLTPNPFHSVTTTQDQLWVEHRVVFWPKQNKPKLLVYNPHSSTDAAIVDIEVLAGPTKLSNTRPRLHSQDTSAASAAGVQKRLVALHLDKPLLAEAFCGPAAPNSHSGTPIDDWTTFLTATERLADYCHWAGYNGAIVSILSEGGSLADFDTMSTTPRFDSGLHSSAAQDPIRKDVIELLLRVFEREGLRLVLEADFSGPIAKLEESRIQSLWRNRQQSNESMAYTSDRELYQSSVDGMTLDGRTPSDVQLPVRYSPLDRRFQELVFQFLDELEHRYGAHSAWDGVALRLGSKSHLQFAGDRWGYSERNFAEFMQSIQAKVPKDSTTRSELLNGPIANLWMSWRAALWNQFMIEACQRLRKENERRSLYLLTGSLLEELPSTNNFSDPLRFAEDPTELLRAHGIDLASWRELPGLYLLHGDTPQPLDSLFERRWSHLSTRDSLLENRWSALIATGATITQQPHGIRLRHLPLDELYTQGRGGWIFPQSTDAGHFARRRLVRRMTLDDCLFVAQGGWLPVTGQEDECRDLLQTIGKLPGIKFSSIPAFGEEEIDSHLVVRYGIHDQCTYLIIMNDSPWSESIQLSWRAPLQVDYEWLSNPPNNGLDQSSVNGILNSELPTDLAVGPFDLLAIKIFDDRPQVERWSHAASQEVRSELRSQLEMLKTRLNQVELHRPKIELSNDSFESAPNADGTIPGWTTAQSPKARFSVDPRVARSGQQSLLIENSSDQASAWMQTPSMPVPATGRLAVEFNLRFPNAATPPRMTLTLLGRRSNGSRYRFSVPIDTTMDKPITSVDEQKTETLIQPWLSRLQPLLHDVVPEDLVEFQIAIDVESAGSVWIDDIRLHDLYLLEEEQRSLRAQIFLAIRELDRGNLTIAQSLLDGYWCEYLKRFVTLPSPTPDDKFEIGDQKVEPGSDQANADQAKSLNSTNESRSWFQRLREGNRKSRQRR